MAARIANPFGNLLSSYVQGQVQLGNIARQQAASQLARDQFDYRQTQDALTNARADKQLTFQQNQDTRDEALFKQEQILNKQQIETNNFAITAADSRRAVETLNQQNYRPIIENFVSDQSVNIVDELEKNPQLVEALNNIPILKKSLGGKLKYLNRIGPDRIVPVVENDATGTTSAMTLDRTNNPDSQVAVFDTAGLNSAFRSEFAKLLSAAGIISVADSDAAAALSNQSTKASETPQVTIPKFDVNEYALNARAPENTDTGVLGNPLASTQGAEAALQIEEQGAPAATNTTTSAPVTPTNAAQADAISQQLQTVSSTISQLESQYANARGQNPVQATQVYQQLQAAYGEQQRLENEYEQVSGQQTPSSQTPAQANQQTTASLGTPSPAPQQNTGTRVNELAGNLLQGLVLNPGTPGAEKQQNLVKERKTQANAAIDNLNNILGYKRPEITGEDVRLVQRLAQLGVIDQATGNNLLSGENAAGNLRQDRGDRATINQNVVNDATRDIASVQNSMATDAQRAQQNAITNRISVVGELRQQQAAANKVAADARKAAADAKKSTQDDIDNAEQAGKDAAIAIGITGDTVNQIGAQFKAAYSNTALVDGPAGKVIRDRLAVPQGAEDYARMQMAVNWFNEGDRTTSDDYGSLYNYTARNFSKLFNTPRSAWWGNRIKQPETLALSVLARTAGIPAQDLLVDVVNEAINARSNADKLDANRLEVAIYYVSRPDISGATTGQKKKLIYDLLAMSTEEFNEELKKAKEEVAKEQKSAN